MSSKTSPDELLRQLATAPLPAEDPAGARARRDRVVANLATFANDAPAKLARRRRFVRTTTFASAAALLLVAGLAATGLRSRDQATTSDAPIAEVAIEGAVQIVRAPSESVAPTLERVAVGNTDEVVTAVGGRARARLASGAEVDIAPESRVRLVRGNGGAPAAAWTTDPGSEAVVLGSGRVTLRVPRLGPMRALAVQTPEATVIVHGTAFSVERSTSPGDVVPRTLVGVTEGSVAVRHDGTEILLHAGDRWSSGPSRLQESEPAREPVEPRSTAPDRGPNRSKSNTTVLRGANAGGKNGESQEKGSSLATENRLLQAAMAARQEGDTRRAEKLATELVNRFPGSPLVEEARVERMRALASAGGSAAASAEARSYLNDYPQGFARQEASRILASAPR